MQDTKAADSFQSLTVEAFVAPIIDEKWEVFTGAAVVVAVTPLNFATAVVESSPPGVAVVVVTPSNFATAVVESSTPGAADKGSSASFF